MAESGEKNSLRDVLRLIFRRRYFFLIGSALLANLSLFACLKWPVKYTGTTKVQRWTDPAATENKNQPESFETIKLTLQEEMIGLRALEAAVEQLGLTRGMPRDSSGKLTRKGQMAKDAIVKKIADGTQLTWEVRKESLDLVSLSVTHWDPKLAQAIPDLLVKNYISNVHERIQRNLTASLEYRQRQVDECRQRLRAQSNIRIAFEEEHAGMMPDRPGNLEDRIQQTIADLDRERRDLNAAKLKLATLESRWRQVGVDSHQDGEAPIQETRGPNPDLRRLKAQLEEYEDLLEAETVNKTEKHPDVMALREKLAEIRRKIDKAPAETVLEKIYTTGVDVGRYAPEVAGTVAEITIKGESVDRLEERLGRLQAMMANFAPIRQEWDDIIRKEQKLEKELERYEDHTVKIRDRLAREVAKRGTHLETVQRAKEQFRPSSPKLFMVLALALVVGLGGGTGLVFLAHTLDRSIATTDQAAEYFGLRVDGVIVEIVTPAQAVRKRMMKWTLGPAATVIILLALLTAGLSNVLRLQYPEKYHSWRASPVGFVFHELFGGEESPTRASRTP